MNEKIYKWMAFINFLFAIIAFTMGKNDSAIFLLLLAFWFRWES